ncbi:MAG: C39 family peptidase [Verrucomicrobiota bacterium]
MSLILRLLTVLFLVFLFEAKADEGEQANLTADLDPLIRLPDAYLLKPADLDTMYEKGNWNVNPYFKWLTQDKSRAIFQRKEAPNLKVDLTLLEGSVPIEEAIIDFDEEGKFLGVTISIFNRGDGGSITSSDFEARNRAMGRHLGQQLAVRPTRKTHNPSQGLLTDGWVWISARGKAVLEHNPGAPGKTEFLRMRLAQRDAGGAYEAATKQRAGATVTLSQLPRNVKNRPDGSIYVAGVPMVDQGAKGYCVVASAQRLFEYYGIACDMHQLAQIAQSDPNRGTSALVINEELGAIDHLFKTRFECLAIRHTTGLVELEDNRYVGDAVPEKDFYKMISKWVGEGIPLLWALEVGRFEEDPPLKMQTSGGHMRMIIGYNHDTNRIIFSDSWGAGHEFKTMDSNDAYRATSGLFLLKPTVR